MSSLFSWPGGALPTLNGPLSRYSGRPTGLAWDLRLKAGSLGDSCGETGAWQCTAAGPKDTLQSEWSHCPGTPLASGWLTVVKKTKIPGLS